MLQAPKSQSGTRVLAPEGTHLATCIGLIEIGTIKTDWQGQEQWKNKIRLTWELPEELHVFREGEEKKPVVISQEYTLSMGSKANLRPIVEGILGVTLLDEEANAFDVEEVVGKSCLITIGHGDGAKGTYVFVKGTAPLLKGMTAPKQINPSRILTYTKWNHEEFDKLPDFIKDKMKGSKEYIKKTGGTEKRGEEESIDPNDIPF